jgi:hypothetical protein
MNSVFVEAKEWFDKTGGNSYFAARIEIDGKEVARLPFQYGYESFYQYEALKRLQAMGLVSQEARSLWDLKAQGLTIYTTKSTALLREVKAWGKEC